jgi:hypothetical protein
MNSTAALSPAQLVASFRQQLATNPEFYAEEDPNATVVMWLVEETPDRTWTPSEVARLVKIATYTARNILDALVADQLIASDDRGAWTRYTARRR